MAYTIKNFELNKSINYDDSYCTTNSVNTPTNINNCNTNSFCISNGVGTITNMDFIRTIDDFKNTHNDSSGITISFDIDDINIEIIDVEILVPKKVVKVTFADGIFEKAICHEDDEFNLETAITVCITKRLLGGSARFNNLVSKALKLYNNKIKAEEEYRQEQERIEAKRKKNYERKKKRIAKKEKEARDARINELAEAINRAYIMRHTEEA